MTDQLTYDYAGVGTASLSSSDSELEGDGPYTIHGIALGAGDVTVGSSGQKKLWPGDELRQAAESLEGQPLVVDHENTSEGTIGTVSRAWYDDAVGVRYEAEIAEHYEQYARDVASGILDVSARAYHNPVEELDEDEDTGALEVTGVRFDNLSIVSKGASPSNTANIGSAPTPALSASTPSGTSVATLSYGYERDTDQGADTEENKMHGDMNRSDTSSMPRGSTNEAPEWEEGDLVRWQVEPDLFGKIVHVDETKNIVMVEIMGRGSDGMESTGFTITAGYSDIRPMQMMESKDVSSQSGHKDEKDDMSESSVPDLDQDELAMINGMDVNGTVMWDDQMGVLSDFMEEDGGLMVEIDVLEKQDGQFQKTGETVTRSLMGDEMSFDSPGDVAELEAAWHTPDWSGTESDREWSKPAMEDFDTDELSEIDDHFIVSKTGEWPPENYGDLALPVVWPNGDLSLNGLDSAHQMAGQVDGISDDMADELQSKINGWAEDEFDEPVANEEMSESTAPDADDDARDGSSTWGSAAIAELRHYTTMTDDIPYTDATEENVESMTDPVVIERDDVEGLHDEADRASELADRLDQMNSSLDELSSAQETLSEIDEDHVEDLREFDDAVVLTADEHEELTGLVDDVGQLYADELADHSPFDSEELQDRFTPLELRDKVEAHDEASIESELGASEEDPDPEGGSASTEELGEPDEVAESEEMEEALRSKIAEQLSRSGMARQAEKVREGEIGLDELGVDLDELN